MFADELRKVQAENNSILLSEERMEIRQKAGKFFENLIFADALNKYKMAKDALGYYVKRSDKNFGYIYYVCGIRMERYAGVSEKKYELINNRQCGNLLGEIRNDKYIIIKPSESDIIVKPGNRITRLDGISDVLSSNFDDVFWRDLTREEYFLEQDYIRETYDKVRYCEEICQKCEELAKEDGFNEARFAYVKVKIEGMDILDKFDQPMFESQSNHIVRGEEKRADVRGTIYSLVGYLSW